MKTLKDYWADFWKVFWQPDMLILPGQLAFFFFLSVVPIITLVTYIASAFGISTDSIALFLTNILSADIASLIAPTFGAEYSFAYVMTLVIGFFIAGNGASSIIVTSNKIYGIEDSGFIKRRVKAVVMTIVMVMLFMFILLVPLLGSNITEFILELNMSENATDNILFVYNLLSGPVSWFVIFFFLKFIFTMAPDRKIPSKYVNYGAIFTSIMWILTTAIYSYYIDNFARYDLFYGGLANIVILMLWVYILAWFMVIGISLNNHKETTLVTKN